MGTSSTEHLSHDLDGLIDGARNGCPVALDKLLEALSTHLWKELGGGRKPRGLGPSHGLSDLVQDTLVRVREKFSKFERDSFGDFKQWARTILYHRRQEWTRNFRFRNEDARKEQIGLALYARIEPQGPGSLQERAAETREEGTRAYAAFQQLKPHEQFVINLRAVEGLSYPEIEGLTGWTKEAARLAYRRAIERLKALFQSDVKL
jgi:RNA polymerase sigma factor (sigma-70 family)